MAPRRDAPATPPKAGKRKSTKREARQGAKAGNLRAAFVREYVKDRNATQAALRAGYSPKSAHSQGQRLLKNVEISRQIAEITDKVAERAEIDAAYVLCSLREVATRCMQGEEVVDKLGHPTGEWRFDAAGANRALELLGRSMALFTDKVKVDLADLRQKSDMELEAEARELGL